MTRHNPIVVAGMHRSGTSLAASMLAASGISMGAQLLKPDPANPRGYFEDVEFLTFNRRLLLTATPKRSLGHPDWGWTTTETLNPNAIDGARERALELLTGRRCSEGRWGWKDPRTSLLLDFWHKSLIQSGYDPAYLLLYRFPWDVADSMLRLGFDLFLMHPEYCYPIWSFYNRALLEFHQKHRDRCLLISTNALWSDCARFRSLVAAKFGINLSESLEEIKEPQEWRSHDASDPMMPLVALTSRPCVDLLHELDDHADLPSGAVRRAEDWRPRFGSTNRTGATLLSVVIACYNDGELLVDAIASIERFAGSSTEIVIVNDGSWESRTLDILARFRPAGYRVLEQSNSGVAAARNTGITQAAGEYILPLDSDDRLCPGFTEAALKILRQNQSVGIVYGDYREIGMSGRRVRAADFDRIKLLSEDFVPKTAVLRKKLWSQCGGYHPGIRTGEHWDLYLKAAERGWGFHRLDQVTFERRIRPRSLSTECSFPEIAESRRKRIVERHSGMERILKS